jgi:hypothetical protein
LVQQVQMFVSNAWNFQTYRRKKKKQCPHPG